MVNSTMILVFSLIILAVGIRFKIPLFAGIGMFFYVWSFCLGFASIFSVWIVEILPPLGSGLAFSTQWLTAEIIGLIGAQMLDLAGNELIMIVFIVAGILSCLVFWLFCHETNGKT